MSTVRALPRPLLMDVFGGKPEMLAWLQTDLSSEVAFSWARQSFSPEEMRAAHKAIIRISEEIGGYEELQDGSTEAGS